MQELITIQFPTQARMNDDEFFDFCQQNGHLRFEREPDGQITIMSPTGFRTGMISLRILGRLNDWSQRTKLGVAVNSDTGFYLPNGAMRNPDAAWVSNERLAQVPAHELDKFPHLVPDFVL